MDPLASPPQEFVDGLTDAEYDEFVEWQENGGDTTLEDLLRQLDTPPAPDAPRVRIVDGDGRELGMVVDDAPFHVVVDVPREGELPDAIEVEVTQPDGGTQTFTLRPEHNVDGPARYKSEPITTSRGGEGGDSVEAVGFEFSWGDLDGFDAADGDLFTVTYDGARASAQIYTSSTRLQLAGLSTALAAADSYYRTLLLNIREAEKQLPSLAEGPEKDAFISTLDVLKTDAEIRLGLAERGRATYNDTTLLDHERLELVELYANWLDLTVTQVAIDAGWTPQLHSSWDMRTERDARNNAREYAKEQVKEIVWHGLAQATIGGYRMLANATLVAQIKTLTTGVDEMGKSVQGWERVVAAIELIVEAASMGAMAKWNFDTTVSRTQPRLPRDPRVALGESPLHANPGLVVSPEQVGMLRAAGTAAQRVSLKHDVVIQVRPTNIDAMVPRAQGATPKPMALKSKTISELDRELGCPDAAQNGCVGLFEPTPPRRTAGMTDEHWTALQKRYTERSNEWNGAIGDKQRHLVEDGEFQLRDGMMCDRDGTPIAGDYDLFQITDRNGVPVSPELYDAVVADLMADPHFRAAHGAHMRWDPQKADYLANVGTKYRTAEEAESIFVEDRRIYEAIVDRHQRVRAEGEKGEGLITFAPNQPPVVLYGGQWVGPKLGTLPTGAAGGAAGPSILVNPAPLLALASPGELLDGRLPDTPEWAWTREYDWRTELADWGDAWDSLTPAQPPTGPVPVEVFDPVSRSWIKPAAAVAGGVAVLGAAAVFLFGGGGGDGGETAQTQTPPAAQPAAPVEAAPEPAPEPVVPAAWQTPSGLVGAAGGAEAPDGAGDYIYSVPGVAAGDPSSEIDIVGARAGRLDLTQPQADELFNDSIYECGAAAVCAPTPLPVDAGELLVVSLTHAAALPTDAGPTQHVYALVFDQDGDGANNFTFQPPFEWDFFRDTDRWYQLTRRSGSWSLEASTWDGSIPAPTPTAARVLVDGATLVWLLPAAELARPDAGWRASAFRHDGSFDPARSAGDVTGADPTQALRPLGG